MDLTRTARRELPFLPGNGFDDPLLRGTHHKRHVFDYRNAIPIVSDLDEVIIPETLSETQRMLQTVTSSSSSSPNLGVTAEPQWLSLEKKVLRFFAYFREGVHESALERSRTRKGTIHFYLEDDTILVSEPRQDNSGIPQGTLIKRHKIGRGDGTYFGISDFNIGAEVTFYGKTFHIVNCDKFTRDFMSKLGIDVGEPEEYPDDEYTQTRETLKSFMNPVTNIKPADKELKRYLEYSFKGRHTKPSREEQMLTQQFLENDRKVLRFYCCWDERDQLYGDFRKFVLEYYLSDGTMKISEVNPPNSGRDPFPVFVKRAKVPKDPTKKIPEYYDETDLRIGEEIIVFSKRFLLYDCDEYTKQYYADKYGITDFEPLNVEVEQESRTEPNIPRYNGFGSEEDSLGSWLYLVLKPPKKDVRKLMKHDRDMLRFAARLDTTVPEDLDRRFIITFHISDDTISVFEPTQRNSGIVGGKFLRRQRVKKPDNSGYYSAKDFHIGAVLTLFNHRFIMSETDEHTIKFMEDRPKVFTMSDINAVMKRLRDMLSHRHSRFTDAFRKIDKNHTGFVGLAEFRELFKDLNLDVSEQEMITLLRFLDKDGDGRISFHDFIGSLVPRDHAGELDAEKSFDIMTEEPETPSDATRQALESNSPTKSSAGNSGQRVFKVFKDRIEQRRLLFQDTFRKITDRASDSLIAEADFRKAVTDTLKINFTDGEMDALVEVFFSNKQRISLAELMRIVSGHSRLIPASIRPH